MKTTSLADVRTKLSRYVDEVVRTHERVTITKNGKPAAVLISAEDLDALGETLFWASQDRADARGKTVAVDIAAADLRQRSTGLFGSERGHGDAPVVPWLTRRRVEALKDQ